MPESHELNFDVDADVVWIDLESCGLANLDPILEVGVIVTDKYGNERARVSRIVSYHERFILPRITQEKLDPIVYKMHTDNGLFKEVVAECGQTRSARLVVEGDLITWLNLVTEGQIDNKNHPKYAMAGASVHYDRRLLEAQMPRLAAWFDYGNYDVSSILRLGKFAEKPMTVSAKRGLHRALPDIEDEIAVHKWAISELVRS